MVRQLVVFLCETIGRTSGQSSMLAYALATRQSIRKGLVENGAQLDRRNRSCQVVAGGGGAGRT